MKDPKPQSQQQRPHEQAHHQRDPIDDLPPQHVQQLQRQQAHQHDECEREEVGIAGKEGTVDEGVAESVEGEDDGIEVGEGVGLDEVEVAQYWSQLALVGEIVAGVGIVEEGNVI